MYVLLSLYGASFFHAVKDLELGEYDFFDETVRFGRENLSSRVFFQRLDARLVRQKSVVQYVELVVEHAQSVTLSHFVHFTLPAQSLVVQRIVVCADEYRLPMQMVPGPLARVEHADAGLGLGASPFLELGYRVTVGAHFFVESDGRTVFKHRYQFLFVGRQFHVGRQFEYR